MTVQELLDKIKEEVPEQFRNMEVLMEFDDEPRIVGRVVRYSDYVVIDSSKAELPEKE